MRKAGFIIIALLSIIAVRAQNVVSGAVSDRKGNPVAGASIAIKNSYDGATSDSTGRFQFTTFEKGVHTLLVSAIGYAEFEQSIQLDGKSIALDVVLKEAISELTAVVITAGAFEASDKKRTTVLNSIDIVTTASANADVTGAIKTLPGAQQVGESEGLFVRGGTAGETRTYIDGTLVNNFFYSSVPNVAQRGRFSPFLFRGTVFSAGGYSALYGQALSSALILESIDLPDRSSASLSVSPIGGGLGFQKLNTKKTASWGLNYNYTFLDLAFKVLENRIDYTTIPRFHTGDANFRVRTPGNGMLKYYGYFSQNNLRLRRNSIDTLGYREGFGLKNFNVYQNLSFRQNLGAQWKLNAGVSYTNNRDDIDGSLLNQENETVSLSGFETRNFSVSNRGRYLNGRLVVDRRIKGLSMIRGGMEVNYSDDQVDYTLFDGSVFPNPYRETLWAGYAEGDIYLTNDLAARVGGRLEHSSVLQKLNLAPRLSLAYKLGSQTQASLAYGSFYQNPDRRHFPSVNPLDFQKATHYIAQLQKVSPLQTFRAELFYKKYQNLLKTDRRNGQDIAISNNGNGYAQGVEIFWRDKQSVKNFDYWLSYSFLDTERDFMNYPRPLEPNFASRHTANLVVKKFVTSWKTQFNANYVFATGRPYYDLRYDANTNDYRIFDQGRTINFNSLSLSVNYLPNVFDQGGKKFTVLVFSVTNVLGSQQVFGYNYSYNGARKEAIVPPTRTFVYLGAFISFGVDRSQEVINSNL